MYMDYPQGTPPFSKDPFMNLDSYKKSSIERKETHSFNATTGLYKCTGDRANSWRRVMDTKLARCAFCGFDLSTIFDLSNFLVFYEKESLTKPDSVNSPAHYNQYQGLEAIDLIEQMNFCRGNAVKYIARAGFKSPDTEIEDLKKARWYVTREIERLEKNSVVQKEALFEITDPNLGLINND